MTIKVTIENAERCNICADFEGYCRDCEAENTHEFDTFVQACDWIRNEFGPNADNCLIIIDTREGR